MKMMMMFSVLIVPSFLMAQTKTKVVTKTPESKTKTVAKTTTPTAAERGKSLYQLYCLVCHQADAGGVGTLNPPLLKEWVTGDKSRLIHLLLKGSAGKVTLDGDTFTNTMPPQPTFTDQQIADVLTYIRSHFGFKASAVTAAEVKSVRAKTK
jgi:mono/diheme cytochrome c family protein